MAEDLPLYAPGYSLSADRYGDIVDMAGSLTERFCLIGSIWRIETGYVTLAADGAYQLVTFTTPATGRCFYGFATVDKSGVEVLKSLIRAGTVTGGTATTGFNYNDTVSDASCPLSDIKVGGTITGGTERFVSLVPGTSNPSVAPGGNSQGQGFITLRQNTTYSLKLLAVGGAVTLAANIGITYIATAD